MILVSGAPWDGVPGKKSTPLNTPFFQGAPSIFPMIYVQDVKFYLANEVSKSMKLGLSRTKRTRLFVMLMRTFREGNFHNNKAVYP